MEDRSKSSIKQWKRSLYNVDVYTIGYVQFIYVSTDIYLIWTLKPSFDSNKNDDFAGIAV